MTSMLLEQSVSVSLQMDGVCHTIPAKDTLHEDGQTPMIILAVHQPEQLVVAPSAYH